MPVETRPELVGDKFWCALRDLICVIREELAGDLKDPDRVFEALYVSEYVSEGLNYLARKAGLLQPNQTIIRHCHTPPVEVDDNGRLCQSVEEYLIEIYPPGTREKFVIAACQPGDRSWTASIPRMETAAAYLEAWQKEREKQLLPASEAAIGADKQAIAVDSGDPGVPALDDDSHLSPTKLAQLCGVPRDALRTRLNRWRAKNLLSKDWAENSDRGVREPKYLYRVGAVRHIIEKMRSAKRPANDQQKKI